MPRMRPVGEFMVNPGAGGSAMVTFDAAVDRWRASQLLKSLPWGRAQARTDARALEGVVGRLVSLAQALAEVWMSQSSTEREAWLVQARARLVPTDTGVDNQERSLARLALEWAVLCPQSWVDEAMSQGAQAWVLMAPVEAGGHLASLDADARAADGQVAHCLAREQSSLLASMVRASEVPVLLLEVAVTAFQEATVPAAQVCESFEAEAIATVDQILACLNEPQGRAWPVALIAQDRALVRRVRALLDGAGVNLADETGWTLTTTRASATVMGLLRLGTFGASADELLDWLKSVQGTMGSWASSMALQRLESALRRAGWAHAASLDAPASLQAAMGEEAWALWTATDAMVATLRWTGMLSLPHALARLAHALDRTGLMSALAADDAGSQVLRALQLTPDASEAVVTWAAQEGGVTYGEFQAWVDAVLDAGMFRPTNDATGGTAQVVVTPLSRAVWRPFAAVVFPGCDAQHLGAAGEPWPWITQAEAQGLGLSTAAERLAQERVALCSMLSLPNVTLLRRQAEGDAPLSASPLLEHLLLALSRRGLAPSAKGNTGTWVDVPLAPSLSPLPCIDAARALWPKALSATSVEALRTCPYQFFARTVLGLREADELTDEIERRDVGTWLHAVLKAFHDERCDGARRPEDNLAHLHEIAVRTRADMGLEAESFLPHAAWFELLAPAYLAWLHDREADGWHYAQGEVDRRVAPPELAPWGIELRGRLDRVDASQEDSMVIDYKTGSVQRLRAKLSDAQEDTQLPFYAALQGEQTTQAAYLPLEVLPLKLLIHEDAAADGARLVAHLAQDWQRMAQGAPLPALGEGEACDFCEMRGLCRRDHWASASAADATVASAEVQS